MNEFFKDIKVVIVLLFALVLILIYSLPSNGEIQEIPFEEEGYIEVEVLLYHNNLRLLYDCSAIDMGVSPEQARSIEHGIKGELWERPGSHDLINDILEGYNVNVLMARVHDLRDRAYIADLFLQKREAIYRLDSRPSDAVAIALRAGAPVEVHRDLVDEHATEVC